jgi:hypothetical protein
MTFPTPDILHTDILYTDILYTDIMYTNILDIIYAMEKL